MPHPRTHSALAADVADRVSVLTYGEVVPYGANPCHLEPGSLQVAAVGVIDPPGV